MISLYIPCKKLIDGNVYFDGNIVPNTSGWTSASFPNLDSSVLFITNHPSREYIEAVVENNNIQLSNLFSILSSQIAQKNIDTSLALSDFLLNGQDDYSYLVSEYTLIGSVVCSLEVNYNGNFNTLFEGDYVHLKRYVKRISSSSCC